VPKNLTPVAGSLLTFVVLVLAGCGVESAAETELEPPSSASIPQEAEEHRLSNWSDLSELGDFGRIAEDIQDKWGFAASSSEWEAIQSFTCQYPLLRPRIPSEGMALVQSVADTNDLALSVWGASISTECPEKVTGLGLSQDAYESLQPDRFGFSERDFLSPYSRFVELGELGQAIAWLEDEFDFRATEQEWLDILERNCSDLAETPDYQYWSYETDFDPGYYISVRDDHYLLTWAVSVVHICPESLPETASWDEELAVSIVSATADTSEPPRTGTVPQEWTIAGSDELGKIRSEVSPGPTGGNLVVCKDGWVSRSPILNLRTYGPTARKAPMPG